MKIAFLNPWRNAAENQAFRSLHEAATRIGHELVHCSNSEDVDACQPDFVLASASTQPKLNDFPHYGVVHEPRDRFLTHQEYFQNLITYDGYLTISDSLERFLRDLAYGVGRSEDIGFYYNTCQRQKWAADLSTLISERRLVITYFGTNWDHRRARFFRLLSDAEDVQICGPEHSWPDINPASYGGAPPFDGEAVQGRYASNGIGLCLLSDLHYRDDVISNRIFEITSVGAIAICCDIPWIRKHYGDSVYYIDQGLPDRHLVKAVQRCRLEIYEHPQEAMEKARRAREIFEQKFAAEVLMENAVCHHLQTTAARRVSLEHAKSVYEPLISVIVRCGGRPLATLERALDSLSRQSYGRFDVILVRYRDIDLDPLVGRKRTGIESVKVVDCHGGSRSTTLWAGLAAVSADYFAVLDDDDWLFSNHFERLFQPSPTSPQERFFAYAGSVAQHLEPTSIMGGGTERRELFQLGMKEHLEMTAVAAAFASNCFVASKDLLHPGLLVDPRMSTAEDTFLILSLLAQAEPRFSYAATSVHERGRTDHSDFASHPKRFDDELTLRTRLFGRHRPRFSKGDPWAGLEAFWARRPLRTSALTTTTADRIVYAIADSSVSILPADLRECVSTGYVLHKSRFWSGSLAEDSEKGSARIQCPPEPWAYGASLRLPGISTANGEFLLIAEVAVEQGEIGIGLLNGAETDFVFRRSLKADRRVQEVHIPVFDFTKTGRLILQNWERAGHSIASVVSLKVFS